MSFKKLGPALVALVLVVTSLLSFGAQAAPEAKSVYIVKFVDNVTVGNEVAAAKKNGIQVNQVLEHAFKGFIGEMTASQALALSKNPRVDFVEADAPVYATQDVPGIWGLDRIDQVTKALDSKYNYSNTGSGVTAYVIDTGILASHDEFEGRVDSASGYTSILDGRGTIDCNGHGTHVAGTIGGKTYGVAKGVTLVPVRVLDCSGSGSISGVIDGINQIASKPKLPAVANLSLGGGASSALDTAVNSLISQKVTVVVAAGNDKADACRYSPARVPAAITVGATGLRDRFDRNWVDLDGQASYSNFGKCLDLYAPGTAITSTWIGGTSAINTISGTSMASPHVAGVVARILQTAKDTTPSVIATELTGTATPKVVTYIGKGSPNLLLYRAPGS